eukprot:1158096-Pelagomonas_calceolata.AAC.3
MRVYVCVGHLRTNVLARPDLQAVTVAMRILQPMFWLNRQKFVKKRWGACSSFWLPGVWPSFTPQSTFKELHSLECSRAVAVGRTSIALTD